MSKNPKTQVTSLNSNSHVMLRMRFPRNENAYLFFSHCGARQFGKIILRAFSECYVNANGYIHQFMGDGEFVTVT
jgi:hypothetical protein